MRRNRPSERVVVVGGGMAGCEAAWQLARRGIRVSLYEMRPQTPTPAHVTEHLAELVCSNSLGGDRGLSPAALLKAEMREAGSLILEAAGAARVEAGAALAVDRERFSMCITERLESHPGIEVIRERVDAIPEGPCIVASGPLTAVGLTEALGGFLGEAPLSFYDAVAPVVFTDSVDMQHAFWGSREGDRDYLNCPLTRDEYLRFHQALVTAELAERRDFDPVPFFEGCLPIEELGRRGVDTPRYGPMKPVGLVEPRSGKRPYALVQLRRDNVAGSLCSLVGFQTSLKWGEQKRVFGLIPALRHAEFARYGVMHRNTYLMSPRVLQADLSCKLRADLWFAGQLIGVEGYVESAASGLLAGINAARRSLGQAPLILPRASVWGALMHYVTAAEADHFQPMNANYGLLPLDGDAVRIRDKRQRRQRLWDRAMAAMEASLRAAGESEVTVDAEA